MITTNRQKGFTIVETLVAITILMIAIAGPLSIASKGLVAALVSRDQMIATYLAQESLEVIKNTRDNNITKSSGVFTVSWINGLSGCTSANRCDASFMDTPTILTGSAIYQLRLTSQNYYSHNATGSVTPFSRYFYLTRLGSTQACLSTDEECTLVVGVTWTHGITPYEIRSSSQLLKSIR